MLQNRVNPLGELFCTKARGDIMGNRGVIHDDRKKIIRLFRHRAWISCQLQFKERHRKVMQPNRWTELFFLDEATAFAAGHRPCAECRRNDFEKFKAAWLAGNPQYGFDRRTPIREIDNVIHGERIGIAGEKITYNEIFGWLPAGTFIRQKDQPCLIIGGKLFSWTPEGYGHEISLPGSVRVEVLTPRSIVNAFREGYLPANRKG